jgi:hypothetical protein
LACAVTLRLKPVSMLVAVTVAPAAGAAFAVTEPRRVAEVLCAKASGDRVARQPASAQASSVGVGRRERGVCRRGFIGGSPGQD